MAQNTKQQTMSQLRLLESINAGAWRALMREFETALINGDDINGGDLVDALFEAWTAARAQCEKLGLI